MIKKEIFSDWQYGIAIIAAPVVWDFLYYIDTPSLSIQWVFTTPLLFLSLIFIQPILEELVFRGLLQGWIIKKSWGHLSPLGITNANIITTLTFTALHFIYHVPLMALAVLIPSLVFGYFRDRYKGWLVPCVCLHCFYNAGYFILYHP